MARRKVQSKKRYLLAFIIGTTIFLLGLMISYSVAYLQYQRVSALQDPVSYEIFEGKLQLSLFDKSVCSGETYKEALRDLAFQGSIIGDLEEKMGKDNKDVLFRKKFYTLILLEHLELINTINKDCNGQVNTILFFYSNEEEDFEESEETGRLLDALYERNKENLFVYSFDINLDSKLVRSLKEKYSVSSMKIVLNENQTFTELNNIDEIQPLLKEPKIIHEEGTIFLSSDDSNQS